MEIFKIFKLLICTKCPLVREGRPWPSWERHNQGFISYLILYQMQKYIYITPHTNKIKWRSAHRFTAPMFIYRPTLNS